MKSDIKFSQRTDFSFLHNWNNKRFSEVHFFQTLLKQYFVKYCSFHLPFQQFEHISPRYNSCYNYGVSHQCYHKKSLIWLLLYVWMQVCFSLHSSVCLHRTLLRHSVTHLLRNDSAIPKQSTPTAFSYLTRKEPSLLTQQVFSMSPLSKYRVACSYQRPRYSSLSLRCSISPSASLGWPRPALYLWCWVSQSHSAAVLVVEEAGW